MADKLLPDAGSSTDVDLAGHAAVERRLAQSLSLLRATFESTADGLMVADGQGRIETFNQRFVELWRLPPEVLAGGDDNAALAFVLDQLTDPQGFIAKVTELYAHPEAESFDVLPFKDGRVFERYSRPQRVGDDVVGRVWSFRDVTERVASAQALADEVRRRRALFDESLDGIVVVNQSGCALEANERFARMLGCRVSDVVGLHIWDWDHSVPRETIRANLLKAPAPGNQLRTRHSRRDGSTFEVEVSCSHLVWEEQPLFLCMVRDITERLRADQERQQLQEQLLQAQKMDAIGQLTGGIAHEFNNLLGVILGYASLAGEIAAEKGDGALVDYLGSIRRAGENARDLVAKLLAFSRRRPEPLRTPQDPAALVHGALLLLRPTLPTSLKIETDVPAGLPAVAIDPMEFQQIVTNLLLNAAHATGQSGRIRVTLSRLEGSGDCSSCRLPFAGDFIVVRVCDDGTGMNAEVQARVFEPFYTTKDVGHGTGMGLAVVHGILHTAGGHVLVDSKPGEGTSFSLLLPVAVGSPVEAAPAAASVPATATASRTFLVIDDQPEVATMLSEMLAGRGHRARVFHDGESALAAFRADPAGIDAVISDQTMPGLSGRDLLLAIRDVRQDVPLVIWTGYSDSMDETMADELGFAGFMRKPVLMEELELLLRKLF